MSTTRVLTYAELAESLGIGIESTKNLVRRKRWTRVIGNDGAARISVPVTALRLKIPHQDTPVDTPTASMITAALQRHIESLESELATIRGERDEERGRAAELAVRAAQVETLIATLKAVEGERNRWHQVATAPRGWARIFRRV